MNENELNTEISKNDSKYNAINNDYNNINSNINNINSVNNLDNLGGINNSDLSSNSQDLNLKNTEVVYDDSVHLTTKEKLKDFYDSRNKKLLALLGGIIAVILVIVLIVFLIIARVNASYKAKVVIPDIVYMGESANVLVSAEGRKNLNKTVTTFKVYSDEQSNVESNDVFSFTDSKVTGKEVMNAITPYQEGSAIVEVKSKLGDKNLADVKKRVVVCPQFSSELLLFKSISLVVGTSHDLKIDYGSDICGKGITYESSNPEIFSIDENGNISALKEGQAILTIKKGSREISVNVYITNEIINMSSFSVLPQKLQLEVGKKVRLKVDYDPFNATIGNILFRSNDESVTTVNYGGLVEAKAPGTTKIVISASPSNKRFEVEVVVTGESADKNDSSFPTDISLNKTEINLMQGNSEKILAVVVPNSAKDKKLNYKSQNENIVTVNQDGVILAKSEGTANVIVSTSNNIVKTIKVNVSKMNAPIITASDSITTNKWHNRPYTISFSGATTGRVYYYGNNEKNMINMGNKVTVSKDENAVYYVKACTISCQQSCKSQYKKDNDINECIKKCGSNSSICSSTATYVSKLDMTKPEVTGIVGIENHIVKEDVVQIAFKDNMSLVNKWCVTGVDNASTCVWKNIQSTGGQVINYTVTNNGMYYVFVRDNAGNVSDSKSFEITNIE